MPFPTVWDRGHNDCRDLGVFIWREFASAPAGTNKLLLTMFISYIVGIVLIIAANQ